MESMVNLVDVMLVFICGLLISIITYWNIDVGKLVTITNQQNMVKVDNPEEISQNIGVTRGFDDVGTALLDPVTGDVYILQEN
ncbi:hypothetical protein FACS1894104_0310 [Actinomycetota bacterium]|nr:hypothetical protein FACS1894104_0310 [Actinomycetota bacterium]